MWQKGPAELSRVESVQLIECLQLLPSGSGGQNEHERPFGLDRLAKTESGAQFAEKVYFRFTVQRNLLPSFQID